MRLALLSLLLLANCAAPASSRQVARLDAERRTEEEQREQSRADLEELLARAKAKPRAPQSTPAAPIAPAAPAAPVQATATDPFDDLLPAGNIAAEVIARFHKAGPHTLLRALETEPARLNGKLLGHRIVSLAPDAAFLRRAQLLPGDIITAVNGASLLTPDEFMKTWSSLPALAAIELNLLRGSESITKRWVIEPPPVTAP
jgi:hypothetical protein